jgi:hypothetical protein
MKPDVVRCEHCREAMTEDDARRAVALKRFELKSDRLADGYREVALPGVYHRECAERATAAMNRPA